MSDSSSQGSGRSLRSKGHIDDSDIQHPVIRARKPAACWTKPEETSFLQFLHDRMSTSGDGGFRKKTFHDAALHLKEKFPQQKGAEKSWTVCQTKWSTVSPPVCIGLWCRFHLISIQY